MSLLSQLEKTASLVFAQNQIILLGDSSTCVNHLPKVVIWPRNGWSQNPQPQPLNHEFNVIIKPRTSMMAVITMHALVNIYDQLRRITVLYIGGLKTNTKYHVKIRKVNFNFANSVQIIKITPCD